MGGELLQNMRQGLKSLMKILHGSKLNRNIFMVTGTTQSQATKNDHLVHVIYAQTLTYVM